MQNSTEIPADGQGTYVGKFSRGPEMLCRIGSQVFDVNTYES